MGRPQIMKPTEQVFIKRYLAIFASDSFALANRHATTIEINLTPSGVQCFNVDSLSRLQCVFND